MRSALTGFGDEAIVADKAAIALAERKVRRGMDIDSSRLAVIVRVLRARRVATRHMGAWRKLVVDRAADEANAGVDIVLGARERD